MAYDELIATITLVGSLLSFAATCCVLASYVVYHKQQRSFRHALVLNLALAEFINSLNNSISGIVYVKSHKLSPSPVCTLNGWVGQLSVQAADFSILAIALVTVLTITRKTYMPNASLGRKVMICMSVWIVPLITSTIATGLQTMVPVSGNWCWISAKRTDLRYALGHGWRFAIIFTTIGVYIYVWCYMRGHFQMMESTQVKGSIDTGRSFHSRSISGTTLRSGSFAKEKKQGNGHGSVYDEELQLEYMRMRKENHHAQAFKFPAYSTDNKSTFAVHEHSADNVDCEDRDEEVAPHVMKDKESTSGHNGLHFPVPSSKLPEPTSLLPKQPSAIYPGHNQPSGPTSLYSSTTTITNNHPRKFSTDTLPPAPTASTTTIHPLLSQPPHPPPPVPTGTTVTTKHLSLPSISSYARRQSHQVEREIKRMLLLNAYPIMYVILWLPGIVNRLLEATGHESKTLAVLQSSSQYVGFANALTYGFNEHLRERIKGDLGRWVRGR
ncbi:hypothetical protein DBV05_g9303 [Lasiodiplodia theobromae]|uniref:Glucose receptor Git3-like N-terminal domain-containing protein n=1 Tax=Lasiodiplodia theobromae TaxID=45133 RepID=A0A5N5D3U9_9PEZI|nr:hypothetical protein DBV05_g9303 [Lasiodiplodia theobromae]